MKKSIGFLLVMGMLGGDGEVGAQVVADQVAIAETGAPVNPVQSVRVRADVFLEWLAKAGLDFKSFGIDKLNPSDSLDPVSFGKIIENMDDPTNFARFTSVLSKHPDGRKLMSAVSKEVLKAKLGILITYDGTNRPNRERLAVGGTLCYVGCLTGRYRFEDFQDYGGDAILRVRGLIYDLPIGQSAIFSGDDGKPALDFMDTIVSFYDQKYTRTNWGEVVRISQNHQGVPVDGISVKMYGDLVQSQNGGLMVAYAIKSVAREKKIDEPTLARLVNAAASTKPGLNAFNKVISTREAIDVVSYFATHQDTIKSKQNLSESFLKILVEKGQTARDLKSKIKPEEYSRILDMVDNTKSNPKDEFGAVAMALFKDKKSISPIHVQIIWERAKRSWEPNNGKFGWNTVVVDGKDLFLLDALAKKGHREILRRNKDTIMPIVSEIKPKNREEEEAKIRILKAMGETPSIKPVSEKEKK